MLNTSPKSCDTAPALLAPTWAGDSRSVATAGGAVSSTPCTATDEALHGPTVHVPAMTCPPMTTPFVLREPEVAKLVQQLVQESVQRLELAQLLTPCGATLDKLQQAHDLLCTAQQHVAAAARDAV